MHTTLPSLLLTYLAIDQGYVYVQANKIVQAPLIDLNNLNC